MLVASKLDCCIAFSESVKVGQIVGVFRRFYSNLNLWVTRRANQPPTKGTTDGCITINDFEHYYIV